jgi:hypothetical protein
MDRFWLVGNQYSFAIILSEQLQFLASPLGRKVAALPIGILFVILIVSFPPRNRTLSDRICCNSEIRFVYCFVFL